MTGSAILRGYVLSRVLIPLTPPLSPLGRGSPQCTRQNFHSKQSCSRLAAGVRKEELLAVDLVARDGGLAVRRDQPIDESLPILGLHLRMLRGIHQHDAVLIEQPPVALDGDDEIAP